MPWHYKKFHISIVVLKTKYDYSREGTGVNSRAH